MVSLSKFNGRYGLGRGANVDRKLVLVRKLSTVSNNKYSTGGQPRTRNKPKPITLPKIDTSDIPEADEEWFKKARVVEPK